MIRPFKAFSGKEIARLAITAALANDLETLTYCVHELAPERRKRSSKQRLLLTEALSKLNIEPIPWLETAFTVTQGFYRETEGNRNLYIVLLSGINGELPGYGLYVGMTGLTPEDRFANHLAGIKASKHVKRYGKCLLPTLYEHLNPISYEEAKEKESTLARVLADSGITVFGGH